MVGVFLNSRVNATFDGCVFEGDGPGAVIKNGNVVIRSSVFATKGQPVDFDGGGSLEMTDCSEWAGEGSAPMPFSIDPARKANSGDDLIAGIVRRYLG